MNDTEISTLLFGHKQENDKWRALIEDFTTELNGVKSDAEDLAAVIQEYRAKDTEALLHLGALYTAAKTKYNQAGHRIVVILTEREVPQVRPDLTEARSAYTAYITEAHETIDRTKVLKDMFRSSMLAAALPVDPTKVFSVILDFIKYFQGRKDEQRKQLIQLIQDNMLVSWLNVRDKKDSKKDGKKDSKTDSTKKDS